MLQKLIVESIDFDIPKQAWSAIEDVIELVDPSILVSETDPIGFTRILKKAAVCFVPACQPVG